MRMTFLEALRLRHPELFRGFTSDDICVIRNYCPAHFFGKPDEPCTEVEEGKHGRVIIAGKNEQKCRECWNQLFETTDIPSCFCDKTQSAQIPFMLEELDRNLVRNSAKKQMLAIRIANEILNSEAFLEPYPSTRNPDKIKDVLTRFLRKNKVSTEDGRAFLRELAEKYTE